MHDGGDEKERDGECKFAIENCGGGEEDQSRGDGARMQLRVDEIEGGAGGRQRKKYGKHGDGSPVRGGGAKHAAREPQRPDEDERDGSDLPEQRDDIYWKVRDADGSGDELVENAGLHLHAKHFRVVGEERGIEIAMDGREVNAVIFDARMIALYTDSDRG